MRIPALLAVALAVAGCTASVAGPATPSPSPSTAATVTTASGPATAPQPSTEASTTTTNPVRILPVSAADLGASWREGCPVGPADLRAVVVHHRTFDGGTDTGTIVVHADVAADVFAVFDLLLDAGFPVERVVPVHRYGASDDASMAANNTSGFNCRRITGGSRWSEHAYGRAIDLNPVQNPYVRGSVVLPRAGTAFLDRSDVRPGMIVADDVVVTAFADIGWGWGGSWASPDYQHVSATGR